MCHRTSALAIVSGSAYRLVLVVRDVEVLVDVVVVVADAIQGEIIGLIV